MLAVSANTQNRNAECQVAGQFLKQPDFGWNEDVDLLGIDAEDAEYASVLALERQRNAGTIPASLRVVAPWSGLRIGLALCRPM